MQAQQLQKESENWYLSMSYPDRIRNWIKSFPAENKPVLLYHWKHGLGVGRGWFQAPDVDGQVFVTDCRARLGEFADVIIERSDAYDLFAREQ